MWYDTESQRFLNYATFGTGTFFNKTTDNAYAMFSLESGDGRAYPRMEKIRVIQMAALLMVTLLR